VVTTIESQAEVSSLVRAAQSGDRAAFGSLYQQFGRLIHGILLANLSYQDAEDLMQDVFVKALQQLPTLREPAAFSGWLVAIARRAATDFLRNRKVMIQPQEFTGGVSAPPSDAFAILAMIQQLPESYRETLVLRLVEGMTGPEIASCTCLTPDSVRVNLCRGMKFLRERLEGQGKQ
jgi:RNA polymerase sigma-70 factor (ECF subfamily)